MALLILYSQYHGWMIFIVPADEVGRGHWNGEHPSVRLSVHPPICPGFLTIILKNDHSMHFKLLSECSELIHFWAMLAQFQPSSGKKINENGVFFSGFRPLSRKLFTLYLRSVLAFGYCGCLSLCVCMCQTVCQLLVRTITWDLFKLGSPNLNQRCKAPCLRSLLLCGATNIDLQGQI